jgi:SHS2 domain-containing protein
MPFEYLDHTADVAVRVRAPDFAGLLREATLALRDIILDPSSSPSSPTVPASESFRVSLEAEDREALLVDYLNEIVFRFDTSRFLPANLEVAFASPEDRGKVGSPRKPARLDGRLLGETFDPSRHVLRTEVKAATFHGIEVREGPAGLEVDVVFDL